MQCRYLRHFFFLASCSNTRYGYIQRSKGPSVPATEHKTEQVITPENITTGEISSEEVAPAPFTPMNVSPVAVAEPQQAAPAQKNQVIPTVISRISKAPETISDIQERIVRVERSDKTKAEAQTQLSGDVRLGIILIAVGLIVLILPLGWVGYVVGSILVIVGIVYLLLGLL